jgi:hypothetical protein
MCKPFNSLESRVRQLNTADHVRLHKNAVILCAGKNLAGEDLVLIAFEVAFEAAVGRCTVFCWISGPLVPYLIKTMEKCVKSDGVPQLPCHT